MLEGILRAFEVEASKYESRSCDLCKTIGNTYPFFKIIVGPEVT